MIRRMTVHSDDDAVSARIAELDEQALASVNGGRPTFFEANWATLSGAEKAGDGDG